MSSGVWHRELVSMDPPARILRLLSLLQSRREWSGNELADRLGVTDRTVRRDIDRLRELGYPVEGTTGTAGGYRMASGTAVPPLLLDDEEAVAVATGLLTAAGGTVAGIEESSVRALAKLEQVLPKRLRHRVNAVTHSTVAVLRSDRPQVDPAVLAVFAAACRDHEVVSVAYRRRDATATSRRLEPHHLITGYHRWYLIAYDLDRCDWRTFRLDRLTTPTPTGRRFTTRSLPAADAATYLVHSLAGAPYRYNVQATVRASAEAVHERLRAPLPGRIQPVDDHTCTVRFSADTLEEITRDILAMTVLGASFTLDGPTEALCHLRTIAGHLTEATSKHD